MNKYLNRIDAGQRLGKVVAGKVTAADHPIVLALPRGGVPVGAEVAKAIGVELGYRKSRLMRLLSVSEPIAAESLPGLLTSSSARSR